MKKIFVALCMVAFLAACDDSSSTSAENSEPAALSSAEKYGSSSSSRHCEECNDEAISSDSNAESNGSSRSSSSEKNAESSSSEKLSETSSSSADKVASSSSSVTLAMPCKTETEDNCEYGTLLDERDGQTYKTVKIGEQIWMAQNLNLETENSWCGGGESGTTTEGNCETYGRLYTWVVAVGTENECGYGKTCFLPSGNIRGVCPSGWHLPTQDEWNALIVTANGSITEYNSTNVAGKALKAKEGWKVYNGITNDDAYGFSALPAGLRYDNGQFYYVGNYAFFWSATQDNGTYSYAYDMHLDDDDDSARLGLHNKHDEFSVRCLKD